ncbi:penicillin-binding protein [Solitalea lacus]|uniref:penicillin-binding protein n=1 Tax=Solitalea lacus TaxID=2911172 RepID=UPI001EDA2A3C|nr:penicillin-binding protein [Solitalea lacus]UKJ06853.1 transpeptidase family protein [Solitalea lacus]
MKIKTDILLRVYVAYAVLFLFAFAIVFRICQLQFVQGGKWAKMADSLTTKFMNVEAVRGSIYSDDGSLIATSMPEYEIRMDVNADPITDEIFKDKVDSLSRSLANLFQDKTTDEYIRSLKKARAEGQRYFLVQRKVDFNELKQLKTFPIFNMGRYKGGLIVLQKNKRILPFKLLASRTIGYYVQDVKPVGLEGAYNEYISGKTGKRLMQRIAGGVWMPVNDDVEIAPVDGSDIISTLNVNIQDVAQNALLKQLVAQNAGSGTVILMEVATGEIRAIANLQRVAPGQYEEKYNTAIGSATEPGSTFKLASFLVGLEDKKFDLDDTVDVSKGYRVFRKRVMRDSHTIKDKGLTMQAVFEQSSNVGTSVAIWKGYKDQPEKFVEGLERLGLGKKMGIQIPGEARPHFKHTGDKDWYGTTLPWLSIGYEQTITPMQTLCLYNAVANNGRMVAPKFVKEIKHLGKTIEKFDTKVLVEKIVSDETLDKARTLLEGVVQNGSAKVLSTSVFPIAGKTGTAQIANGKLGYRGNLRYQASFCGYFPANNPKYSMIVVINEPTNKLYYGGAVAAPVFKEVADKVYATQLEIHQGVEKQYALNPKEVPMAKVGYRTETEYIYNKLGISYSDKTKGNWVKISQQDNSVVMNEAEVPENVVPSVVGMSLQDAIYILENAGLRAVARGSGKVVGQSISAGSQLVKGRFIGLELR